METAKSPVPPSIHPAVIASGRNVVQDIAQLLVIGVGNDLRQDDAAGLHLARQLHSHFSGRLTVREEYGPDISLSQTVSRYRHLLIIDALAPADHPHTAAEPFVLIPLAPAESFLPTGFTSHIFNWPQILAAAGELFHAVPQTHLLGITAHRFGISQHLTPKCRKNTDSAFQFLIKHYF